jgi:hypothetical protein
MPARSRSNRSFGELISFSQVLLPPRIFYPLLSVLPAASSLPIQPIPPVKLSSYRFSFDCRWPSCDRQSPHWIKTFALWRFLCFYVFLCTVFIVFCVNFDWYRDVDVNLASSMHLRKQACTCLDVFCDYRLRYDISFRDDSYSFVAHYSSRDRNIAETSISRNVLVFLTAPISSAEETIRTLPVLISLYYAMIVFPFQILVSL